MNNPYVLITLIFLPLLLLWLVSAFYFLRGYWLIRVAFKNGSYTESVKTYFDAIYKESMDLMDFQWSNKKYNTENEDRKPILENYKKLRRWTFAFMFYAIAIVVVILSLATWN